MDRRPSEERRKIFTRKVIQKLYNYTDEKNAADNYAKNKASKDVDDGGNTDDEIVPNVFPSNMNCKLKLTRSEHSSTYSTSTSGMDFNNPKTGQKKTVTSTLNSDKLSPYLTDDEDSEENGTRKRKRKRCRHRASSTPRVSNNRSSSSSSTSSKIQKSSPQTAALQLSRNQRRKLKRKKREKRIKIDANKTKSVAYSYTFKPKIQF